MPLANIKNVPKRVNLDDDIRLLEDYDMRSATNVRTMSSSVNNSGTLENIKSTLEIVVPNFPSGDVVNIGNIEHSEKNDLYMFFFVKSGLHCIVRYNSITQKGNVVISNSLLKFNKKSFISGFAITGNNDNETLLYWTDNINQPRMINVTRMERYTAGDYVNGYPNPLTEQHIRWIKYPPLFAPTIQLENDDSITYNNIATSVFQFRYRYRYKDGEYSAYSPISDVSVSEVQLLNNSASRENDYVYNKISVTVKNSWNGVEDIEIVVREGNNGDWLVIDNIKNDASQSESSIGFWNDGKYTFANNEDTLKNYDAVPLSAATAEYVANRAVIANAIDGFNSLEQSEIDDKVTFGARYSQNYDEQPIQIAYTIDGTLNNVLFDTSGLTIVGGSLIVLDFYLFLFSSSKFTYIWRAEYGDTITDFLSDASSFFTNRSVNQIKCTSVVTTGNDLLLNFDYFFTGRVISSYYVNASEPKPSFKAGAKHPIGIVYYDEAGRHGSVQRKTENGVYVEWFSERIGSDEHGAANIDWRIGLTPPISATHYQLVYAGNSSVGKFLQYTTAQVEFDKNSKSVNGNKNLYVIFNNFLGEGSYHVDSYVTSRNPLINYQYSEGDRIRIIKKPTGTTINDRDFVNEYLDFKILGFEYYEQLTETNPVYSPSSINNFGWILTVEDNEIEGWDYETVKSDVNGALGDNQWFKVMANGQGNTCLVEIYNTNSRNVKDVYYEFGEEFLIQSPRTAFRKHKGFRDQNVNITPKTIVNVLGIDGLINNFVTSNYIDIDYGTSTPDIFVGDKIVFTATNANTPTDTFTVARKTFITASGVWRFYLAEPLGNSLVIDDVSTVTLHPDYLYAAGTIEHGDVWLKPRTLITGNISTTTANRLVLQETVEDYYANDFFKSDYWRKGRPHIYSPTFRQERRKATLWISEPLFPDNKTNGLSSFNLAAEDKPFKDYDRSLGAIELVKRDGDSLILFQENKTSRVLVQKDTITTGDGNSIISLTGAVLSEQNPYAGGGICKNPESHAEKDGRHYFVDIKRGKVLRLSQDGLTPISDYKFSSLLDQLSRDYMSVINSENLKIYGGFDKENDEYNITFTDVSVYEVTVNGTPISVTPSDIQVVDDDILIGAVFKRGAKRATVTNGEIFTSPNVPAVTFEEIVINGSVTLDEDLFDELQQEDVLEIAIQDGVYTLAATASLQSSEITIPTSNGNVLAPNTVAASKIGEIAPITITFHEGSNSWCGYRSYIPQGYASLNYLMFGFKNGIYLHEYGADYNSFYGTDYQSKFTPVLKDNPSMKLILKSLSTESNMPLETSVTSELMSTSFTKDRWVEMEGFWYSDVTMAKTTTNSKNSNVFGIGILLSHTVTTKTFAEDLTSLNINIGDTLINNTSTFNLGAITDIDYGTNTITHTTNGFAVNGTDFFYFTKSASSEGEPIRGYAFEVELEQNAADAQDLLNFYSLNGHAAKSNLTLD